MATVKKTTTRKTVRKSATKAKTATAKKTPTAIATESERLWLQNFLKKSREARAEAEKAEKKSATKAKTTTAKKTRKATEKQLAALKKARESVIREKNYHLLTRAEEKTTYLITDKKKVTWQFWLDKEGRRHCQIWRLPDGMDGITKKQLEGFKLPDVIFDKKNLEKFKISDNVLGLALPLKNIKATFGNDGYVITDANDVEHLFYFSKKGKGMEYDGWCAPARLVLGPKAKKTTARKTAKKTAPKAKKTTKK